jgi:hypothetical protein
MKVMDGPVGRRRNRFPARAGSAGAARRLGTAALTGFAGDALAAVVVAPANAATAARSGASVVYLADKGETNDVLVSTARRDLVIADPGAVIVAGDGCAPIAGDPIG